MHIFRIKHLFFVFSFQELKQAFRLFDKEGKGEVKTQIIGSVLRNLGLFPTEVELNQLLKDIDIDGKQFFLNSFE